MTLRQWRERLKATKTIVCVYRWYWGTRESRPAPANGRQVCVIDRVRPTQLTYFLPESDKPALRNWMYFPKARDLRADDHGFELYFPNDPKEGSKAGKLMSRYEWGEA